MCRGEANLGVEAGVQVITVGRFGSCLRRLRPQASGNHASCFRRFRSCILGVSDHASQPQIGLSHGPPDRRPSHKVNILLLHLGHRLLNGRRKERLRLFWGQGLGFGNSIVCITNSVTLAPYLWTLHLGLGHERIRMPCKTACLQCSCLKSRQSFKVICAVLAHRRLQHAPSIYPLCSWAIPSHAHLHHHAMRRHPESRLQFL